MPLDLRGIAAGIASQNGGWNLQEGQSKPRNLDFGRNQEDTLLSVSWSGVFKAWCPEEDNESLSTT
jgi:hypothetical protein